jgi:hypothetical protein
VRLHPPAGGWCYLFSVLWSFYDILNDWQKTIRLYREVNFIYSITTLLIVVASIVIISDNWDYQLLCFLTYCLYIVMTRLPCVFFTFCYLYSLSRYFGSLLHHFIFFLYFPVCLISDTSNRRTVSKDDRVIYLG